MCHRARRPRRSLPRNATRRRQSPHTPETRARWQTDKTTWWHFLKTSMATPLDTHLEKETGRTAHEPERGRRAERLQRGLGTRPAPLSMQPCPPPAHRPGPGRVSGYPGRGSCHGEPATRDEGRSATTRPQGGGRWARPTAPCHIAALARRSGLQRQHSGKARKPSFGRERLRAPPNNAGRFFPQESAHPPASPPGPLPAHRTRDVPHGDRIQVGALVLKLPATVRDPNHGIKTGLQVHLGVSQVECSTLDLGSGHDPRVVGSSPVSGSAPSVEPAWYSPSLSAPLPCSCAHMRTLSLPLKENPADLHRCHDGTAQAGRGHSHDALEPTRQDAGRTRPGVHGRPSVSSRLSPSLWQPLPETKIEPPRPVCSG